MGSARDRLLEAADDRFYREGINASGIDTVTEAAGVAKMSLYNNFRSKDDLVVAYFDRRHRAWEERLARRAGEAATDRERILAVFDTYLEYGLEPEFRGCGFINGAAELPPDHPAQRVVLEHKRSVADRLRALAAAAGARDPEALGDHLFLLLEGGVAAAGIEGHAGRLRQARELAASVLEERTPEPG